MIWLPIIGRYTEIDAYASALAYAELLNQRSKPATVYLKNQPNYSVPESLRIPRLENFKLNFQSDDQAIILDISIPEVIHEFCPDDRILELIDHHPGHEDYWRNALGDRAIIEPIGAVATSIFEWWGECWDYAKMAPEIAKLLLAAIFDNTLDFNAEITTERDRVAAQDLAEIAQVSVGDFAEWYFSEVSNKVLASPEDALINDTKIVVIPSTQEKFVFGQLTVWSIKRIHEKLPEIRSIMDAKYQNWLLSIIDISAGQNLILTNSQELGDYFTKLLGLSTTVEGYLTQNLLLRKEIMKRMVSAGKTPQA